MKFMYFSIKYRYSDILLKKTFTSLCCNHTCYCANMVSVTSAARYITPASHYIYHPRYQSRSMMYIRGLILRKFANLAEAVPIGVSILTLIAHIKAKTLRRLVLLGTVGLKHNILCYYFVFVMCLIIDMPYWANVNTHLVNYHMKL